MGRKKWSEIRAKASPETLEQAAGLLVNMRLRELREARGLTQSEVAERLSIRQVSVSKLEARSDVRVSTLRAVLQAMGGELDVRARFTDGEFRLNFGEADAHVERVSTSPVHASTAGAPSGASSRAAADVPAAMHSWTELTARQQHGATHATLVVSATE